MKVVVIGSGRMGEAVEAVASELDHEILCTLDRKSNASRETFSGDWLEEAEALIDFSVADAVAPNVVKAVKANLPIVVGVTGWEDQFARVQEVVVSGQGACLYSSNFSIGVNVLFHLAREAARLMSRFPGYEPYLWEAHHKFKLDAPSGTARTLQGVLKESYPEETPVASTRAGHIPGQHVLGFDSPSDQLVLEHTARDRRGFATGSLIAAEWLLKKKGLYTFEEVIFG